MKKSFITFCSLISFAQGLIHAQITPSIPKSLTNGSSSQIKISEVYQRYDSLMSSSDSSLNHAKKKADRWMNYGLTKYFIESDSSYNVNDYSNAIKSYFSSGLSCNYGDIANWEEDGPSHIPDWGFSGRQQQSSGWVDAVYCNPNNVQNMLLGTRTSGIYRTTNGGLNWNCVTDGLNFAVLGVGQIVANPNNPNYLLAVTGTSYIAGTIIKSSDGGITWQSINQPFQNQPYWIDFHPTINGLVFAAFDKEVMYSVNNGDTWTSIPNIGTYNSDHNYFHKITVFNNHFFVTSKNKWNLHNENFLYKGEILNNGNSVNVTWQDLTYSFSNSTNEVPINFNFSNKVGNKSYLQFELKNTVNNTYIRQVLKSLDNGLTYNMVVNSPNLPTSVFPGKNELIASINQNNTFYIGELSYMRKYDDNGNYTDIQGTPGNNGHHDDYRSSSIIDDAGKDRMLFGNDGGIGLVKDGTVSVPTIESCNGDLSINLIHAFDIHEGTKKVLYAFQDHAQLYRNPDGSFSSRLGWESSTALIQQTYPNAMVIANGYTYVYDDPNSTHHIVNGYLGNYGENYLGSYFYKYKHHPYRFLKGMGPRFGQMYGKVGINRGINLTEKKAITESRKIGAVAGCDNDVNYIYAAEAERLSFEDGGQKLYRSTDDGLNFVGVGNPTVLLDNGSTSEELLTLLSYNNIRSIAVHPFDGNTVYCGIGSVHKKNGILTSGRFRVIKSIDGGSSFVDYSEGLPGLPIEEIITVESDNELIFCGTSVGVFYRTKDMNSWACFSNNLPKVEITGMKFDYCDNVLYVSTYGRGMWKSDVNIDVTNSQVLEISSNKTWSDKRRIANNVVVKTGNTLTITGEILFDRNIKITVEKGAKLIVDGGKLTKFCSDYWQGIEVLGDRDQKQYETNQGLVWLKNGATVEYALNAVSTKKTLVNGWDFNSTGGIVRASNSFFINNKRDVEFLSYHFRPSINNPSFEASNRSSFSNCVFRTDDNYSAPSIFPNVTQWDVNGVHFNSGNVFEDNRTNLLEDKRDGILSIDATYYVNNNSFNNLNYGIKAFQQQESTNGKYILIDGSTFNSLRGVYFNGVKKSKVNNNTFNTDNTGFTSSSSSLYGIYLNFCDHYEVEENIFNSNANINGGFTWGVLVSNHHGWDTEIYKNTFNGHPVGIEAIDQNKPVTSSEPNAGLEIICNQFTNSLADIFVADGGTTNVPIKGISSYQGNTTSKLADNLFATGSITNFGNENDNVTYLHHQGLAPSIYDATVTPLDQGNGGNYATNCPSNSIVGPIGTFGSVLSAKNIAITNLLNAKNTYYSLVDGGEIATLEMDVKSTVDAEAYDQYMELMNKSGYLSEEVLMEVAKKEDVFTLAMIRNILVANPLAAKIKELDKILDNRINQLPLYMRNQIKAGKTMLSTKEFLELEVIRNESELDVIIQDGVELIAADSNILNSQESLLSLLNNTGVLNYDLQRLNIYAASRNIDEMDNVKSAIESSYKLSEQQAKHIDDVYKYMNMKITWEDKGYTINQLPQNEINSLKELEGENTLISSKAMGLLALNNKLDYQEPVFMPELSKSYNINIKDSDKNPDEYLLIYPNPASDFISVRYSYLAPYNTLELSITDIQGRLVHSELLTKSEDEILIELNKFDAGNYVVSISANSKTIFSDKVIIK